MAKQGQHQDDANDKDKSPGNNNPSKSVEVTTGNYKKPETYQRQAAEHKANNEEAQHARHDWNEDTRDKPSIEDSVRARDSDLSASGGKSRSGSDSNADTGTRG
jgi:hypothetical protein